MMTPYVNRHQCSEQKQMDLTVGVIEMDLASFRI